MLKQIFILFIFLTGCASEVVKIPANLSVNEPDKTRIIQIQKDTIVSSSSGYTKVIKVGSKWELIGEIEQGSVYKIIDDVFIVEGAHVHEAHIVIKNEELVGYYLPALKTFSISPEPTVLNYEESEKNL